MYSWLRFCSNLFGLERNGSLNNGIQLTQNTHSLEQFVLRYETSLLEMRLGSKKVRKTNCDFYELFEFSFIKNILLSIKSIL